MKSLRLSRLTGTWLFVAMCLPRLASAQTDRITGPIDHYRTVLAPGHLNPMARPEFDRGAVAPDFALRGMTLVIRRTDEQQRELDELLSAQQNPASPRFHQWLTPEQFGERFGASANDLSTLRQWLESKGFRIKAVARGRSFIRFDATAEQLRYAFGSEIHDYQVGGVKHYANASEPALPANVAPLVLAIRGMDDFGPHPHYVKFQHGSGMVRPDYTFNAGPPALAPGDLYTIYDFAASYGWGWKGSGQTIVIIGASDVAASDIALYRSSFGLSPTTVQTVYPDGDPGLVEGWNMEGTMDLEISGAAAPSAQLVFDADGNVWNAMADAIDNFRGQIISMSFGMCELGVSPSAAASYEAPAQQANAEGITLIASAGDSGATGCNSDGSPTPLSAPLGAQVQLPASLPEVTGVGGTEFNEGLGSYWGSTNAGSGGTAKSYIPEVVWNDILAMGDSLWAGGGGASALYQKPVWQTGIGVPDDGSRDVPDIALSASALHDGYVIAMNGALSTAQGYTLGGTSAGAPLFAGIVAVLNSGVFDDSSGNVNPILYAIAAGGLGSQAFHDVTSGDNRVDAGSSGFYGFYAAAGYDQASGLGSVDVAKLNQGWAGYSTAPAIYSLSPAIAAPGVSSSVPVTVSGTRFQSGDTVYWTFNSATTALSSSFTNASTMTATVPASLLAAAGTAQIQVVNSAGLYSGPAPFTITGAIVTGLAPSYATAGGKAFTLTVNGSGFVKGAQIRWNSTPLSTTFSSASKLTGAVTQAMIANPASVMITVVDGTKGTSVPTSFNVQIGTPTITGLSPNSAAAGGSGFTLTVNGANYISSAVVIWGSTQLTTTFINSTKLTATVARAQLASAGKVAVTVTDGMTSAGSTFTVAAPAITAVSPKTIAAGSGDTTLVITGTNFIASGSTVYAGTTQLTATANSATSITATIPSNLLGSTGSQSITVRNPNNAATSSAATVTVAGPAISSLSPKTIPAGSPDTTLVITGTNFVSGGSTAYAGTTQLTVSAGTATSITAKIPSSLLGSTGSLSITVQNPNASATSSASIVTVVGPAITAVSPKTIAAGSPDTTVVITGTNFVASGSSVYAGTTQLTVSAGTATSITAKIPSSLLGSTGSLSITIQNPNASATSSASTVTVVGPAITTLSPKTIAAGSSNTTLVITGTNFIASGSTVFAGTTQLTATANSATSITATIPSSLLGGTGTLSITVQNPNNSATSSAATVTVAGPAISLLGPNTISAGSPDTTLVITGTNFVSGGSTAYAGTTKLTTSAVSATSITATLPTSLLGGSGVLSITVKNPNASATSGASTVTVVGPAIASLSPSSNAAGASAFTLTVNGTNFLSGATVMWGTKSLTTTFSNSTKLVASVTADLAATAGSGAVSVTNPGGSVSGNSNFTITARPTITSLSPASANSGGPGFTLTVNGTSFVNGAKVWFGTTALATTYVGGTKLTASVPASAIASSGTVSVTVVLPCGATTAGQNFKVN